MNLFKRKKAEKDVKPRSLQNERVLTAEGWRRRFFKKMKKIKH